MNIRRILCPTDLSETSALAVEQAVAMAGYYKAAIFGQHVVQLIESVDGVSLEGVSHETAAFFETAAKAGLTVDVEVEPGSAVHQILDHAARLPADLLVMGTHGSSGFEHLVLGSVTEKVLRKAS